MLIGTLIQSYRESCGQSVRTMAKTIGVNHNALWRFERGEEVSQSQWVKIMVWMLTADAAPAKPSTTSCKSKTTPAQ